MIRVWQECARRNPSVPPLAVNTVIVDECGCTPESSTALLLRLNPRNLILIGDHKQLPPSSILQPTELAGTGHARSLFERCVLASGQVRRLDVQYRMPAPVCALVSHLFYRSGLETAPDVAADRASAEPNPVIWVETAGVEGSLAGQTTTVNVDQAILSVEVAMDLRTKHPGASIAIITFYKGQLTEITKRLPAALGVDALTVDACQGCEYAYVVLSTVRANPKGRLGFCADPRRINVAISRVQRGLTIVGNAATMNTNASWLHINKAATKDSALGYKKRAAKMQLPEGPSVWDATQSLPANRLQVTGSTIPTMLGGSGRSGSSADPIATSVLHGNAGCPNKLDAIDAQRNQQRSLRESKTEIALYRAGRRRTPREKDGRDATERLASQRRIDSGAAQRFVMHSLSSNRAAQPGRRSDQSMDPTMSAWAGKEVTETQLYDMFEVALVAGTLERLKGDTQRALIALLEAADAASAVLVDQSAVADDQVDLQLCADFDYAADQNGADWLDALGLGDRRSHSAAGKPQARQFKVDPATVHDGTPLRQHGKSATESGPPITSVADARSDGHPPPPSAAALLKRSGPARHAEDRESNMGSAQTTAVPTARHTKNAVADGGTGLAPATVVECRPSLSGADDDNGGRHVISDDSDESGGDDQTTRLWADASDSSFLPAGGPPSAPTVGPLGVSTLARKKGRGRGRGGRQPFQGIETAPSGRSDPRSCGAAAAGASLGRGRGIPRVEERPMSTGHVTLRAATSPTSNRPAHDAADLATGEESLNGDSNGVVRFFQTPVQKTDRITALRGMLGDEFARVELEGALDEAEGDVNAAAERLLRAGPSGAATSEQQLVRVGLESDNAGERWAAASSTPYHPKLSSALIRPMVRDWFAESFVTDVEQEDYVVSMLELLHDRPSPVGLRSLAEVASVITGTDCDMCEAVLASILAA